MPITQGLIMKIITFYQAFATLQNHSYILSDLKFEMFLKVGEITHFPNLSKHSTLFLFEI